MCIGGFACVRGLLGACGGVSSGVGLVCSVSCYCMTCEQLLMGLKDQRVLGDLL